jgi:hypothetical protein
MVAGVAELVTLNIWLYPREPWQLAHRLEEVACTGDINSTMTIANVIESNRNAALCFLKTDALDFLYSCIFLSIEKLSLPYLACLEKDNLPISQIHFA